MSAEEPPKNPQTRQNSGRNPQGPRKQQPNRKDKRDKRTEPGPGKPKGTDTKPAPRDRPEKRDQRGFSRKGKMDDSASREPRFYLPENLPVWLKHKDLFSRPFTFVFIHSLLSYQ